MSKYQITVTDEQLTVLNDALDLYSRVRCGAISGVISTLPLNRGADKYALIQAIASVLQGNMTQNIDGWTSSLSIHSEYAPESAKIAWDMQQVFRHKYYWNRAIKAGVTDSEATRVWPDMMQVHYDPVMQTSLNTPLATIEEYNDQ